MKKLISVLAATTVLFGMATAVNADVSIYKKACLACHAYGPGPKVGNKEDWKARIAKGMPTLVDHAIKGFTSKPGSVMPAKGGRADLTDAQVKSAVKYMVDASK